MSNDITIIPEAKQPVLQSPAVTLIQTALAAGHSPEHLRELLAVRRDWEADEARKAMAASVASFQARCPIIEKGDKAYDKDYARIDRIWREIRPLMSELGLAVTWQVAELREGSICHIEGQLQHKDGASQKLTYDVPVPDLLKGQNKAQQMGSATTYAKRYALCSALGIQTGEDDDGHKAGTEFVSYAQATELEDLIAAARGVPTFEEAKFWAWAEAKSAGEIPAAKFAMAKASLQKKIKGGAA